MAIQLSEQDFDRLAGVLALHGEWRSVRSRVDFMTDVFAGTPGQATVLPQLDLDGTPRGTAVRVIHRLATYGQHEPGEEALGVLVNKLVAYLGGGEDVDFLRDLLRRYPFETPPIAARDVGTWRGHETEAGVLEKIIGENTLRDVYVLEVLGELARAVCRIRGRETGTGFLIADDLVMTNHHVIASPEEAAACAFQFNYQLDRTGVAATDVRTATAVPGGLLHTSGVAAQNAEAGRLDYTVVQLQDVPDEITPLRLASSPVRRQSRVTIIQHPGGHYKKISFQNNFVEYADAHVVQYTTSTEPGSSGAPVLDDAFDVIALHHAGGALVEPSSQKRYLRNEGIRMAAILGDLEHRAPDIFAKVAR